MVAQIYPQREYYTQVLPILPPAERNAWDVYQSRHECGV